jgi:glycosyltransferase involved in cell wall biosynthesis
MANKYFLIGPFPPPLGGVSVYIYRYGKLLKDQGIEVEFIDFNKMSSFKKLKFLIFNCILSKAKHTFHLNGFTMIIMLALILRPFNCEIILQNHSIRILDTFNYLKKLITNKFINKVDKCILVGEHLRNGYVKNGIKLPKNTLVNSPFLPPPLDEEEKILSSYSNEVKCFIDSHDKIMIANASIIEFYEGVDLYGLDMCIDAMIHLKKKYSKLGLIFALAEIGKEDYFEKLIFKIKENNLENNILFLIGQKELWPLFKKADIMVRPTYSDAYGISIEEAIYFNCKAIASNVCKRPNGTILFENRNLKDFISKIEMVFGDVIAKEK